MKPWAIWCEGYAATGESSTASLLGHAYGDTFKEACDKFFEEAAERRRLYNRENLTYWGCRLFDNPTDARRSFG